MMDGITKIIDAVKEKESVFDRSKEGYQKRLD
jgi:hypothetical protein